MALVKLCSNRFRAPSRTWQIIPVQLDKVLLSCVASEMTIYIIV